MPNDVRINNKKKYCLALCEFHCLMIHGKDSNSCPDIDGHYMVVDRFDPFTGIAYSNFNSYDTVEEIMDEVDFEYEDRFDNDPTFEIYHLLNRIEDVIKHLRRNFKTILRISNQDEPHPVIRNYYNILRRMVEIKYAIIPDIIEAIVLPTHETIAIKKTFWLRIIQRKWKKIIEERKKMLKERMKPTNIYKMQINGKNVNRFPTLRGMLSDLSVY